MKYFSDMNLVSSFGLEGQTVIKTESWFFCLEFLDRSNVNGDGVEDMLIRFTDDAVNRTDLTGHVNLFTGFSHDSDLQAMAFGPAGDYSREEYPGMIEELVSPPRKQRNNGIM